METQRDGVDDPSTVSATPASSPTVGVLIAVWAAGALAAAPIFWHLSAPDRSDIDLHAGILLNGMATGSIPWYTIWYGLLFVASFGQATSYEDLRLPAVVILSTAMGAKAAVTLWMLGRTRAPLAVTLLAVLFTLVVVPLRLGTATTFYLGKITPTIWHNPTTVMLMPVSLVLFVIAIDVLRRESASWFATVGLVGILVVDLLMKPNFGLVFLPVFGVYVLTLAALRRRQAGWWRPLARYSVMAVVGVAVLGAQYWGTYARGAVDYVNAFEPLAVWRLYTPYIPLAATESLLLPVIATISLWRGARDRTSIVLAWCCTALGLVMFALLSEIDLATGTTLPYGNWSWAMHVSMFVLTVMLVREWLYQRQSLSVGRRTIIASLATFQFVTGLFYLAALATTTYG